MKGGSDVRFISASTQLDYVCSLRPLWTLDNFEFNGVSFVQGFVSLAYDSRVVDKYVWTVPTSDEAIAFRIIEPFDYTLHLQFPP
jgi:hypothetical protein